MEGIKSCIIIYRHAENVFKYQTAEAHHELTTPRFNLLEASVMHLSERCLTPLKHCFKHHFSHFVCLFTVGLYAMLPTDKALLSLRGLTGICPHKQGLAQMGGTLQKVEIEIHNVKETQLLVMLSGQLSQLRASYFCVQHSMNLSLYSDKPLGFHIGGFLLAFSPYFVWHLKSCHFLFWPWIFD